eukprot:gene563-27608_t
MAPRPRRAVRDGKRTSFGGGTLGRQRRRAAGNRAAEEEEREEVVEEEEVEEEEEAAGSDVSSQLADLRCVRQSGALSEQEFREAAGRVMAAASRDGDEESLVTVWDTAAGRPLQESAEEKRERKK